MSGSIGRNLDAFDDILSGGFGVHDYEEPVQLTWLNSNKSRHDLGWEETVRCLAAKLSNCHHSNRKKVQMELIQAEKEQSQTLFERFLAIIRDHKHIELFLR